MGPCLANDERSTVRPVDRHFSFLLFDLNIFFRKLLSVSHFFLLFGLKIIVSWTYVSVLSEFCNANHSFCAFGMLLF